jgi:glycosyltransferase involved in cell wall biosynthesis
MRRLVAAGGTDVFHAHLSSPIEAVPALLAARLGGARKLVTTEHAPTWYPLRRFYSKLVKRAVSRMIAGVIAVCESDAAFLHEEFGIPRDLITVIPNGVASPGPLPSRRESRARLGLPGDARMVVGYLGAIEEKKGVLDLIEAASLSGLPRLVVALGGDGALLTGLREKARAGSGALPFELSLPGQIEDVWSFLSALDIFVLPSRQEAMPLALLEAMCAGLPIVASKVGGIPEAIEHGVTGILVPPGAPGEIAAALRLLAAELSGGQAGEHARPGGLAGRLGDAARRAALARFTSGRMVLEVDRLYSGLLQGKGRSTDQGTGA